MPLRALASLAAALILFHGPVGAQPAGSAVRLDSERYQLDSSRWIQQERRRAAAALESLPAAVLLVPFQVEGDSFDAIERSLLTRTLAAGLRSRSTLTVADPTVVEQALGTSARTIRDAEVLDLARRVRAITIVRGFVGHDNHGKYAIRVEVANAPPTEQSPPAWRVIFERQGTAFDDTHPPFQSFRAWRDEIADAIVGPARAKPQPDAPGALADRLPASFDELEQMAAAGSVERAALLQFLGSLHPRQTLDRARDGLFERSLIALDDAPDTSVTRLLRARAWAHLYRRPLALATVGTGSVEQRALRAYLDGNLEQLTAAVETIRNPLLRVVAAIERESLRSDYDRPSDPTALGALTRDRSLWTPLLMHALAAFDAWADHSPMVLKAALDQYWPRPKYELSSTMRANLLLDKVRGEYTVAQLVFQHLDDLGPLPPGPVEGPGRRDVAELIREMQIATVTTEIEHLNVRVQSYERAMAAVSTYEALLADQPDFVIAQGWTEFDASTERAEPEKSNLQLAGYEHLREGALWSQGQTASSERVLELHHQFFPGTADMNVAEADRRFFGSDWPNRPDWGWVVAGDDDRIVKLRHCIDYTISGLQCLIELHATLASDKDTHAAAAALLAANRDRFVGHPGRTDFLASVNRESGDDASADAILRKAIADGTKDWEPYRRIGTALAISGKPREALDVVLKYPGFRDPSIANRVQLSNNAYEVGSLLYWAGAYEEARPLYEFAAALQTGSDASITSESRLALLDDDFEGAMGPIVQRARRYGGEYPLRDLVMFAGALGDRETAWTVWNGSYDLLPKPEFWLGAFALHRMEGATLATIAEWAVQGERAKPRSQLDSYAQRYVFLSQVIDRDVTDDLAAVLRERDPGPPVTRDNRGQAFLGQTPIVTSGFFGDPPPSPDAKREGRLDNRLTMAASALAALARKDYTQAYEVFDEDSHVFDLQEFLPYYAFAAALLNKTERIERYLENSRKAKEYTLRLAVSAVGPFFDDYLAQAALNGVRGKTDVALDYLVRANADVLHTTDRAIFTRYEVLEIAELLYEHTHEKRYREFLVDLARRYAKVDPVFSYPYAFVAKYTDDAAERRRALARALYLDPQSKRALSADGKDVAAAQRQVASGSPFLARGVGL